MFNPNEPEFDFSVLHCLPTTHIIHPHRPCAIHQASSSVTMGSLVSIIIFGNINGGKRSTDKWVKQMQKKRCIVQ
jgi:hypothetical protein